MKVMVDRALCSGHGRCAKYAPQVFTLNDSDGYNSACGQVISVAPEHEESARLGMKSCPERAISEVPG